MNKEFKVILFALFCLITFGTLAIQWIYTGNFLEGIKFVLQIYLMMIAIIVGFGFFVWLGFKIFGDK